MAKNKEGVVKTIIGKIKNRRNNVELASKEALEKSNKISKWQEFKIAASINLKEFKDKFRNSSLLEKVGYVALGASIPVTVSSVTAIVQSMDAVKEYSFDDKTIYSEYIGTDKSGSTTLKSINVKSAKDAFTVLERDKSASEYINLLYLSNYEELKDFKELGLVLIDKKYQQINCPTTAWLGGGFATTEGFFNFLNGLVTEIDILVAQENDAVENLQIRETAGLECGEQKKQVEFLSETIRHRVGIVLGFIDRVKEINSSHYFENLEEAKSFFNAYMSKVESILTDDVFADKKIIEIVKDSNEQGGTIDDVINFNNGEELIDIANSHLASLSENLKEIQVLLNDCDEGNFAAARQRIQKLFILIENDAQILDACKRYIENAYTHEMALKNKID